MKYYLVARFVIFLHSLWILGLDIAFKIVDDMSHPGFLQPSSRDFWWYCYILSCVLVSKVELRFVRAYAREFFSPGICVSLKHWNLWTLAITKYLTILASLAWYSLCVWLTLNCESLNSFRFSFPIFLARMSLTIKALYSLSILVALKLHVTALKAASLSGEMRTMTTRSSHMLLVTST